MTAEEARSIAKEVKKDRIEEIKDLISQSAHQGKYECIYIYKLTEFEREYFRTLGYYTQLTHRGEEVETKIKW